MAKSFHLKEIIDHELSRAWAGSPANRNGNRIETDAWRVLTGRRVLDEPAIWKTAVQLETFGNSGFY